MEETYWRCVDCDEVLVRSAFAEIVAPVLAGICGGCATKYDEGSPQMRERVMSRFVGAEPIVDGGDSQSD